MTSQCTSAASSRRRPAGGPGPSLEATSVGRGSRRVAVHVFFIQAYTANHTVSHTLCIGVVCTDACRSIGAGAAGEPSGARSRHRCNCCRDRLATALALVAAGQLGLSHAEDWGAAAPRDGCGACRPGWQWGASPSFTDCGGCGCAGGSSRRRCAKPEPGGVSRRRDGGKDGEASRDGARTGAGNARAARVK